MGTLVSYYLNTSIDSVDEKTNSAPDDDNIGATDEKAEIRSDEPALWNTTTKYLNK